MFNKLTALFQRRANEVHQQRSDRWVAAECERMQSSAYLNQLRQEAQRSTYDATYDAVQDATYDAVQDAVNAQVRW